MRVGTDEKGRSRGKSIHQTGWGCWAGWAWTTPMCSVPAGIVAPWWDWVDLHRGWGPVWWYY